MKRKQTERAVRKRSGKDGRLRFESGGGGRRGGDISTTVVILRVKVVILMRWDKWGGVGFGGEVHGIGDWWEEKMRS